MDERDAKVDLGVMHPEARVVSAMVIETLRRTKGWTRFLSVLGFVSCGFMLLAGLAMLVSMLFAVSGTGPRGGPAVPTPLGLVGVIYIVAALFAVIPSVLLGRYASRIGVLMKSQSEPDLVAALDAQRSYWKLIGVLAIVMVSLYLLGIITFVMVAMSGGLLPTPALIL